MIFFFFFYTARNVRKENIWTLGRVTKARFGKISEVIESPLGDEYYIINRSLLQQSLHPEQRQLRHGYPL